MKSSTALTSSYQLLVVVILTLIKIRQSNTFTTCPNICTAPQLSSILPGLPNVGECPRQRATSRHSTNNPSPNEPPPSSKRIQRPAQQLKHTEENRRDAIFRRPVGIFLFLAASSTSLSPASPLAPLPAWGASRRWEDVAPPPKPSIKPSQVYDQKGKTEIDVIREACTALQSLLDNWDKATIDCNYADVPRELLESKNKEELLEKAATFALFDKGAVTMSCRRTNRLVRDYIGVTGKGPLVGLEKKMLSRGKGGAVELVDPDMLDDYYSEVDAFSRAISQASSLSYTAGMADLNSVNNFAKDDDPPATSAPSIAATNSTTSSPTVQIPEDSNLDQARKAVMDAKVHIDRILKLLSGGSSGVAVAE